MAEVEATLFDCVQRKQVLAEVVAEVDYARLVLIQHQWDRFRTQEGKTGGRLQSEWDWARKRLEFRPKQAIVFGVMCEGVMQGLMLLRSQPEKGVANPRVLHIEFLEAAPWNVQTFAGDNRRYAGVDACSCSRLRTKVWGWVAVERWRFTPGQRWSVFMIRSVLGCSGRRTGILTWKLCFLSRRTRMQKIELSPAALKRAEELLDFEMSWNGNVRAGRLPAESVQGHTETTSQELASAKPVSGKAA